MEGPVLLHSSLSPEAARHRPSPSTPRRCPCSMGPAPMTTRALPRIIRAPRRAVWWPHSAVRFWFAAVSLEVPAIRSLREAATRTVAGS